MFRPRPPVIVILDVDVERRAQALSEAGVAWEVPLAYDPERDVTRAVCRDPDGRQVVLQRFEDLAWPRPAWARMPELPRGLEPTRRTPDFHEETVPAGLLRDHTTRAGTWGRIEVAEGLLRYRIRGGRGGSFVLRPGRVGVVRPEELHHVELLGPVRFAVQFLRAA